MKAVCLILTALVMSGCGGGGCGSGSTPSGASSTQYSGTFSSNNLDKGTVTMTITPVGSEGKVTGTMKETVVASCGTLNETGSLKGFIDSSNNFNLTMTWPGVCGGNQQVCTLKGTLDHTQGHYFGTLNCTGDIVGIYTFTLASP